LTCSCASGSVAVAWCAHRTTSEVLPTRRPGHHQDRYRPGGHYQAGNTAGSKAPSSADRPVSAATSAGSSHGSGRASPGAVAGPAWPGEEAAASAAVLSFVLAASTAEEGGGAANSSRTCPVSPRVLASSPAVSLWAVRLIPRSRSLSVRGLSPAASASSPCVSGSPGIYWAPGAGPA
jgi:hypothetical protein